MDRNALATSVSLLSLVAGNAPDWVQLTPISNGSYKAVDGRAFEIDDADKIIRLSMSEGAIGIDYDHATDYARGTGSPAPAAGWIEEIKSQGPNNEPGLWGRVKWTPKAKQAIADGEYRYISPSTYMVKDTLKVISIFRAALTNCPALTMKALFTQQETTDLSKNLRKTLGLADTATDAEVLAAVEKLNTTNAAMCSREKLLATAAGIDVANFVALDDSTTTALCTKLKTPAVAATGDAAKLQGQVDELQKEVALLTAQAKGSTAVQEVEAATKAGKITPKQKEWAIEYCSRDPEGFRKFIGAAPAILSNGRVAPEGAPEETLSESEIALCSSLQIKHEDFKATRKAQKEALS